MQEDEDDDDIDDIHINWKNISELFLGFGYVFLWKEK
jgi:hypothetical protein